MSCCIEIGLVYFEPAQGGAGLKEANYYEIHTIPQKIHSFKCQPRLVGFLGFCNKL